MEPKFMMKKLRSVLITPYADIYNRQLPMKASTSIETFYVNSKEIKIVHVRHFTVTTPSLFGKTIPLLKRGFCIISFMRNASIPFV